MFGEVIILQNKNNESEKLMSKEYLFNNKKEYKKMVEKI